MSLAQEPDVHASPDRTKCDFLVMLNAFLVMALPPHLRDSPPSDLLQTCLNAVLPICNGEHAAGAPARAGLANGANWNPVRGCLAEYCDSDMEEIRSASFMKTFNLAFDELKNVNTPLVPWSSENNMDISFQYDEPSTVYMLDGSQRRSGVVLIDKGAASVDVDEARERPPDCFPLLRVAAMESTDREEIPETLEPPPAAYSLPAAFTQLAHHEWKTCAPVGQLGPPSKDDDCSFHESDIPVPEPRRGPAFPSGPRTFTGAECLNVGRIPKRKAIGFSFGPPPKRLREMFADKLRRDAVAQAAAYAFERRSAVPVLSHSIMLVVVDSVAWVWRFDRAGAIHSGGVDFVTHLPYFLVLLLAFQRFTMEEWGVPAPLSAGRIALAEGVSVTAPWHDAASLIDHFRLVDDRCVVEVTSDSVDPRDSAKTQTLEDQRLVAKFCWAKCQGPSEAEIIRRAHAVARTNDKVRGHIPDLVAARDFDEVRTERIRTAFGMSPASAGGRLLRVLLFLPLLPITILPPRYFWTAFLDCFVCHYELWQRGIRHRDISPGNLMYRVRAGTVVGVLNDFDLAALAAAVPAGPDGHERVGTLPFLALDLPAPAAVAGRVAHRCRHDAESFLWTLAWVCIRVRVRVCRDKASGETCMGAARCAYRERWGDEDMEECRRSKGRFLLGPGRYAKPSKAHRRNFERYESTLGYQIELCTAIALAERRGVPYDEPLDSEVFETYMRCFSEVGPVAETKPEV